MKNPIFYVTTLFIGLTLGGCQLRDKIIELLPLEQESELKDESDKAKTSKKTIESIEIKISCNRDTIQKYIDSGWKVVNTTTSEVPCSWKSTKSSPDCDIDRDKGCSITVPDLIGDEIKYLLERESRNKD